jgi:DNA phosphorothioation-dependent restriction protein DptH
VSWGSQFSAIVENIVEVCIRYYESISPDGPLSDEQKKVINIGRVCLDDDEFYSPYHPLVLAYFLNLKAQIQSDENDTFANIPSVTLERLAPAGLLPFSYHPEFEYAYNQQIKENAFWIRSVPQEKSTYDFIRKLVNEKIDEFQSAFSQLFEDENNSLIVNAVNLEKGKELFLGIVDYMKANLDDASSIHVNLYDQELQFNAFDEFAETVNYDVLKQWLGLDKRKNASISGPHWRWPLCWWCCWHWIT